MNRLLPTRRLIPRWRRSRFSAHQRDLVGAVRPSSGKPHLAAVEIDVERAFKAWQASGAIGELADLLSYGVDPTQRHRLIPAAKAALEHHEATFAMKLVAREILGGGVSEDEVWKNSPSSTDVRGLRALLRNTPDDVIALVDLAQHHLAHGKKKAALRTLLTAYQISPNSVHVVRALTRYWIHVGERDRAHAFIKRTSKVASDPWVMASEIATAQVAGSPSTQLRKAQRALRSDTFSPLDLSELAGAVGGAELWGGNIKEARKLFRLALEHPNDNVLAQAITNQGFLGIDIDESVLRRAPNGVFEGRALRALSVADFQLAAALTECWAEEEAFSSRPRTLQSFVCGALGTFEASLEAADKGLVADPTDLSLRGNRAYALAAMNRLDEAEAELAVIEAHGEENRRPFSLATKGMVTLLRGHPDDGRRLYEEALESFQRKGQDEQYTDCLAFMARTFSSAGAEDAAAVVQRAAERHKKHPSLAASVILRQLEQQVQDVAAEPLRRVVQWEWNPETNTLIEKRELTRKGAPGFVIAQKKDN
jgi:tetratricopeptide (TPR) repeat protein